MGQNDSTFWAISIHALREEGDHYGISGLCNQRHFYPRPPRGGRLHLRVAQGLVINFYPRPPRGGRQDGLQMDRQCRGISIHALREEGDARNL